MEGITTQRIAARLVLPAIALLTACSLLLPAREQPDDGGGPDALDGSVEIDGDRRDSSHADGDTVDVVDADHDEPHDADVDDAEADVDGETDAGPCAAEETCTDCSGESCHGACEDENCDGFSLACPGSDSGDERLYVEPPVAQVGEGVTIRVCSRGHGHGCVYVVCEPPGTGEDSVRLVFGTHTDTGGEHCWTFVSDPEEDAFDTTGRWTCTFFSKVDVSDDCEDGTSLAHVCGVLDIVP